MSQNDPSSRPVAVAKDGIGESSVQRPPWFPRRALRSPALMTTRNSFRRRRISKAHHAYISARQLARGCVDVLGGGMYMPIRAKGSWPLQRTAADMAPLAHIDNASMRVSRSVPTIAMPPPALGVYVVPPEPGRTEEAKESPNLLQRAARTVEASQSRQAVDGSST